MKKFLTAVATLCVFAMLAGIVSNVRAEEGEKKAEVKKVQYHPIFGPVTAVDAKAMTFEVAHSEKAKHTFAVNADTKITKGDKAFNFADIVKGNFVTGFFVKHGDKMVATQIDVYDKAPEAPAKEEKAPEVK